MSRKAQLSPEKSLRQAYTAIGKRTNSRAKLRRGEWPGQKPFGYVYDHRLRSIVPEPKEAKIVRKIYEESATGRHTLKSISARLAELGGEKARSNYSIENLLTNARYIGVMRWSGETYEGKYRPLISKQLFAKVQEVLANRRKPRKSKKRHDFPFVGLFRCSCGSMFTAQFAKGNGGLYQYYRCTRRFRRSEQKKDFRPLISFIECLMPGSLNLFQRNKNCAFK